jgi:hypothetical protein
MRTLRIAREWWRGECTAEGVKGECTKVSKPEGAELCDGWMMDGAVDDRWGCGNDKINKTGNDTRKHTVYAT